MAERPRSYMAPGADDPTLATINMLVYSHPGEGKTCFWGSGNERVLIMVSDPEGIISARSLGYKVHSVLVTNYDELQDVYMWLKDDRPKGFDWVVWDSLTLFQDRALHDDIMEDAVAEFPKQDRDVPDRRQYLQSMNRIGRYIREFVDLPYNFGVSCHADMDELPGTNGNVLMPDIQGKRMPSKISGYMNIVGFLHKRQVEGKTVQSMQLGKTDRIYAKNRFANSLPNLVDKPTLPMIDAAIQEWRKKQRGEKSAAPRTAPVRRRPQPQVRTGA